MGGQLAAFADRLGAILVIAPEAEQPLHRIVETATALLQKVQTLKVVT